MTAPVLVVAASLGALCMSTGCAQTQLAKVSDQLDGRTGTALKVAVTTKEPVQPRVATAQALLASTPYAAPNARRVVIPRLPTPTTQGGAKRALEAGLRAMADSQWVDAAGHFRSVLRTDFLTDPGRVNVYWFTAEAHRHLHDVRGEADALSGFLLAASVLEEPANEDRREIAARTALAAFRLSRDPNFGRTKEVPIRVMDAREPMSILAALGCRDRVRTQDEVVVAGANIQLVRQVANCESTGQSVQLWFDVSEATLGQSSK